MKIINKNGDIIDISPKITSLRKSYLIRYDSFEENIKAVNGLTALFKFCLKHPLILFKIDS